MSEFPSLRIHGIENAPEKPGIYAFVRNRRVVYLGSTGRTIRQRLTEYCRGQQKKNRAVHNALWNAITEDAASFSIWVLPMPDRRYHGLPVCVAKGVEWRLLNSDGYARPEFNWGSR